MDGSWTGQVVSLTPRDARPDYLCRIGLHISVLSSLPSGPAPGNCDGLDVVTTVTAREKKTGRLRAPITASSVQL